MLFKSYVVDFQHIFAFCVLEWGRDGQWWQRWDIIVTNWRNSCKKCIKWGKLIIYTRNTLRWIECLRSVFVFVIQHQENYQYFTQLMFLFQTSRVPTMLLHLLSVFIAIKLIIVLIIQYISNIEPYHSLSP